MGKIKTHKGTKKVLNIRKSGTVTMGHPGSRHNTGSKSAKFNRKVRKSLKKLFNDIFRRYKI